MTTEQNDQSTIDSTVNQQQERPVSSLPPVVPPPPIRKFIEINTSEDVELFKGHKGEKL